MERDNLVKMKMLKGKSERKAAAEEAKKLAETEAAGKATA
jgi:V/A-type H+-transporting ATPase subunit D